MSPPKKQKNSIAASSASFSNSKKQSLTPTISITASTPAKFGIQHFFTRHSHFQLSKLKPSSIPNSSDVVFDSIDRESVAGDAVLDANPVIELDLDGTRISKSTLLGSDLVDGFDSRVDIVSSSPIHVGRVKPVTRPDADRNPNIRPDSESTPNESLLAENVDCEVISPQLPKINV